MAIPFVLPDEDCEIDVILTQLVQLITKLQREIRSKELNRRRVISTADRVRNTPGSSRSRGESSTSTPDNTSASTSSTHVMDNLSILAQQMPLVTANTNQKHPAALTQDWMQVGETLRKIADNFNPIPIPKTEESSDPQPSPSTSKSCSSESFFSRLVPWTAVICVVGWHLLR